MLLFLMSSSKIQYQMVKQANNKKPQNRSFEVILRKKWWILRDLNPRPGDYESPALTN